MNRPFLLFVLCLGLLAAHAQTTNPAPTADTNTVSSPTAAAPTGPTVETLICVRHGEKTHNELGQLSVKGLNRSLALTQVLLGKYGKPDYIFAPDPAQEIGNKFCYVRPLATIEPTAIYLGMPVNTLFGLHDFKKMEDELEKPMYQNALVFIAWEHMKLELFARDEVTNHGGDGAQVPGWTGPDFDSIYVVKISRDGGKVSATSRSTRKASTAEATPSPARCPSCRPRIEIRVGKSRERGHNRE